MLFFRNLYFVVPFFFVAFLALDATGALHKPSYIATKPPKASAVAKLKALKAGLLDASGKPEAPGKPEASATKKLPENIIRNWGLDNSEAPSHIEAKRAWKITEGSSKVVVAVIDTGIDSSHIDLKDNLWHKDGTDEFGWDFVLNKKNPVDDNGHGSHIAGIIGGTRKNRFGALGVSPHVSIMPVRYFADDAVPTDTVGNIVKAIDYAVANGARIINFSSEGIGFNMAEYRAIERASKKGVLVVTAAGNRGQNNDRSDTPC